MTNRRRPVQLTEWASTLPWDCLVNPESRCISPDHDHNTMVGDPCAVVECREPLLAGETCYYVTELPRDAHDREQAVCWRHIRYDQGGPITTDPGPGVKVFQSL